MGHRPSCVPVVLRYTIFDVYAARTGAKKSSCNRQSETAFHRRSLRSITKGIVAWTTFARATPRRLSSPRAPACVASARSASRSTSARAAPWRIARSAATRRTAH
eukprot:7101843-Prymnesium_polylepis.1